MLATVGSLADRSKSFRTEPDDVVAVPSENMPVLLTQDEIELFVTASRQTARRVCVTPAVQ
ncbi:hypothetical protein AJ87_36280 [Rhizobium yanglingense]|nr:hypothetical protein AJ87_36280 [Rhizobium yanglingense]